MSLQIAKNLKLPDEAVTQTFAILAKRGVGKTYTASVMVEEMLKNHLPVVVLDPIGVWWGLRAGANGKGPGMQIIIAGGDHADVPISPDNGELVANLVVNEKLPLVIDLSLFRKGEQTTFVTAFAETLYHKNRAALHVVLDEADAFAPQRPMPGQQRMLGAIEDLVRRGRARGIGVTMITQRPAVLNKDVLTQIEVLVAMRLVSPQDRGAINEWVKVHGEPGQAEELMASLPSLPVGTAWFWSPGWLDLFRQVKVRTRETLDSSSTPKVGKLRVEPRKLAKVDLEQIKKSLAATIERQQAEDPKILQRRVVELERQLADQKPQIEIQEVPVLSDEQIKALTITAADLKKTTDKFNAALQKVIPNYGHLPSKPIGRYPELQPAVGIEPKDINTIKPAPMADPPADGEVNLRAGERRILQALAQHYPMQFTRAQLGTISRFSSRGGTFGTYVSTLRRYGLIAEQNGSFVATMAGLNYLGADVPAPQSSAEVIAMWRNSLRAGERKILDLLVDSYPNPLYKEQVGTALGFEPTGGTFGTYISNLRRNGLIEVEGKAVRASDNLFKLGG